MKNGELVFTLKVGDDSTNVVLPLISCFMHSLDELHRQVSTDFGSTKVICSLQIDNMRRFPE